MANINAPYGFIPLNGLTGEPTVTTFAIASGYGSNIACGDPVVLTGTGVTSLASVALGVASADIVGIFQGVNYVDAAGQPQWSKSWVAGTVATNVEARVITDPYVEYRAQIVGGSPAVTMYGQAVGFVIGTPSLQMSTAYLDGTTIGSGTDFQIRRAYESPSNEIGANMQVVGVLRLSSYNAPYTAV